MHRKLVKIGVALTAIFSINVGDVTKSEALGINRRSNKNNTSLMLDCGDVDDITAERNKAIQIEMSRKSKGSAMTKPPKQKKAIEGLK